MLSDYIDTFQVGAQADTGTPTLNGNSDLGIFGSISQIVAGAGSVADTVKSLTQKNKPTTNIISQQPLAGGLSTKTMLYIGGGIVVVIGLIFLLKRK